VVSLSNPYDPGGRRIEKSGNGEAIKYCYDGDHVIAEYDGNDRLLRKYVHGARVDEPVCMIDVADSNAVYYYHFDGLGSVVALSDSNGDSCQSYEYTVYGQVAAEDPNHPNPYMFTGRQFDIETGLYYYRARYYNPHIGRFMQTDPVGYADGINWYLYCRNNPLLFIDPSGTTITITSTPEDLSYMDPMSDNFNPFLFRFCPQPSNWTWQQYFIWYMYGGGAKVNMGHTGLLDLFMNDPQIIEQVEKFEAAALQAAYEAWLEYISDVCDINDIKNFVFSYSDKGEYSFDDPSYISAWINNGNPLVILGDGTHFLMDATIIIQPNGSYEATFTYYVSDTFRDPLNIPYIPYEFGTPYILFGEWRKEETGWIF